MELDEHGSELRRKQDKIRTEMGGQHRIDKIHDAGGLTIRERIDRLVDDGSFSELGTFAHSEREEDRDTTPGDGKIGGLGRLNGRPVVVAGDDITVKRASSSHIGSKKLRRLEHYAMKHGQPFIYFGETGGARLPDMLEPAEFVKVQPGSGLGRRNRSIPMTSVIVGQSFGGSSFVSAFSDFVVQVKGSCLAVTSPRVIEIATGEKITFDELGGIDVHDKETGMIDRVAETEDEAIALVGEFLSYLPQNAWESPPRTEWDGDLSLDEHIYKMVPTKRQRGYDMRRLIKRLTDDKAMFELKPNYGKSLITGLGRVAGRSVGFIASNPMQNAGAITPAACDKATLFTCMCDAFNIPLIYLQDTPGFMVGRQVEHDRLLSRAIMMVEAMTQARVPRITVVIRKAFGLAYAALSGNDMGGDALVAWPNAEISFMDPEVGVNVTHAGKLAEAEDPEGERARLIEEWRADTSPMGAAGNMAFDEIIDPAETRAWLRNYVDRMHVDVPAWGEVKPLGHWPTCL